VSEAFYKAVRFAGSAVFRVASRPVVLHAERVARTGAFLLAANHESPFDAALLIAATPRVIYWLSIVEIFRQPFARWFLTAMLASPLDRSRVDTRTVRLVARHLRSGRVVGIFPEGGVRVGADSVLAGGNVKDGVARIAELARVPVLPCVVLGGIKFHRWSNWLPLFRTRWAVAFGEPLDFPQDENRDEARAHLTRELERTLRALHDEVKAHV
jgi:1-acyl-sn-glycerol-3-phosphate acyltransferase